MYGKVIFSSVFAMGKSSAIGRYEEGSERFFLVLVMWMVLVDTHF